MKKALAGRVLWLTGLSGSGKSTLARNLKERLRAEGTESCILDGDVLRNGLNSDLSFSEADRHENIRRAAYVAQILTETGIWVLAAFITPYRSDRERIQALFEPGQFNEIFVDCPLEVCQARDPKKLYEQVRSGKLDGFTGISAPYEAPLNPTVRVNTDQMTVEQCVDKILQALWARL